MNLRTEQTVELAELISKSLVLERYHSTYAPCALLYLYISHKCIKLRIISTNNI